MDKASDPKAFLMSIMDDESADPRVRVDAAKCLMPFCHPKLGEVERRKSARKRQKRWPEGSRRLLRLSWSLAGGKTCWCDGLENVLPRLGAQAYRWTVDHPAADLPRPGSAGAGDFQGIARR